MQRISRPLAFLLATALATEAAASGAGGAIYVPGRVQQASHTRSVGGHGGCDSCKRVGFAGVDHATPPPCSAEGGCHPNQNTFGWSPTRWRTWPGTNNGATTPQPTRPEAVRDVIETPAPEDEDRQAPPAIDDVAIPPGDEGEPLDPTEGGVEGGLLAPPVELPPLPRPALGNPPPAIAPPADDAPPALPFDFGSYGPAESEGWKPAEPASRPLPVTTPSRSGDGPPPLPPGLTRAEPAQLLRHLPRTVARLPRFDSLIQPASAQLPTR